jgi:glucose/mannose-6-phosphate isomerase
LVPTIYDIYLRWYDLALRATNFEVYGSPRKESFQNIILSGMGGSGIVCDMIYSVLYSSSEVPVTVVKDFQIPRWTSKNSLLCAISYSGNTLETLNTVLKALEVGAEVCVVTSGGKLLDLARVKGLPHVVVDGGLIPRAAFPQLLIATVKLLSTYGVNICSDLKSLTNVLRDVEPISKTSKELADFLKNSLPVVISNMRFYPLAMRFKDELNENSKMMAKVELVPEWAHNDIVGWELPLSIVKSLVIWDDDLVIEFLIEYLRGRGVELEVLKLLGDDLLSKMLYGSYIAGLTSVYLAELRGVKAEETKSIDMYKEFLRRRVK